MQAIERRMDGLERSVRWQIIVPSLTLIVSIIIHYVFK